MQKKKIRQIISRQPITIPPDTPAAEAVAVMAQTRISCLVVADGKKPVGILTERDVVRGASRGAAFGALPIREVMTTPVVTIPGSLSLYEAYNLLLTNRIRHHVVVDRGGEVTGVVSQSDLINHLGLEYFVEMRKIEQVMSREVETVQGDVPVRESLCLMAEKRISCVVIVRDGAPVGILTERDAARLVAADADLAGPVEQAMSSPVRTVAVGTTVHKAAILMKQEGIRRVLVLDGDGRIAGIVTQSDIVKGLEGKYIESLKKIIREKEDILKETARELLDKSVYLDGILSSSIDMAIIATDLEYRIKYFNPVAERVFGYHAEDVIGRSAVEMKMIRSAVPSRLLKTREIVGKKGEYLFPLELEREGGTRSYEGRVTSINDRLNRLSGYVLMLRDVTERKHHEEAIRYLAYHDALTGLPNRALFSDRLSQVLAYASRSGAQAALMILDLDRFKQINDTLGHRVGDLLLRGVSRRLKESLRKSDTVSRMGGDEFVLLLPKVASMENVAAIARKILKSFQQPFECDGQTLNITTSIGISMFPDDGGDEDTLLKNADIALYRAKEEGRNTFRRYSPPLSD
ncbi:MAG TPA: diguanylate cyclase [Geobacteraceae bacterium]